MGKKPLKLYGMRLDPQLVKRLKQFAKEQDMAWSELGRTVLARYVGRRIKRQEKSDEQD